MGKEMEQEDRGRGTVMKKTFVILLAAVTVLMGGLISVYAEDNAAEEQKIFVDIKNICTLLWAGDTPQFSVELDPSLSDKVNVVSEKWIDISDESYELTVGGENIAVAGGKYRYELTLSTIDGFVFDNELTGITYHVVNGDYRLHYDYPPEDGNHTMIVKGDFDNIIAASPLKIDVGKLLAYILSEDYTKAVDFILDEGFNYSDNVYVDNAKLWAENAVQYNSYCAL